MEDEDIVDRLALAARSSASFPVAFEPSWVPCEEDKADADHPSMKGIADFHGNHFVIDGGVLVGIRRRRWAPLLRRSPTRTRIRRRQRSRNSHTRRPRAA